MIAVFEFDIKSLKQFLWYSIFYRVLNKLKCTGHSGLVAKIIISTVLGLIFGFQIGLVIPYLLFESTIGESGGDGIIIVVFMIFTVPICTVFGGILGWFLGLAASCSRPFSKREISKIFKQSLSKEEIKIYYSALKKGYDTGEQNTENAEELQQKGLYDGAKIKAYGNVSKVLNERISIFNCGK